MSTSPPAAAAPVATISPDVLAAVYADARRCYPEEACGLLYGPRQPAHCEAVRVCENQQNRLHALDPQTFPRDARTAYNLAGKDLLFLTRTLDASESEPRVHVIYHSHVEVGAYFSAEDVHAATFEGEPVYPVDYLVIDCRQDRVHGAKLFRFSAGQFVVVAEFPGQPAS